MDTMFPHVVTVYNTQTEESADTGFEPVLRNYITILDGVYLEAAKGANVAESGLTGADAVNLYIPAGVNATDGVTGTAKKYVGPVEFWRTEDKSGLWTLSANRNTFFVKGAVVQEDWTQQKIEACYDDVYDVTKVDDKDVGGDMAHWEVGGV